MQSVVTYALYPLSNSPAVLSLGISVPPAKLLRKSAVECLRILAHSREEALNGKPVPQLRGVR